MTHIFTDLLNSKSVLLADGATGTNLFNMGLEAGEAPELWNVDKPENITKLYQMAVDSGSDLFLTNSFGGNASRLKLHQAEGRVDELNQAAAKLARAVADSAGRPVIVAGSMGPTGEIMEPVGSLSHDDAVAMFKEQGKALLDGGVDLLWVETISSVEEFKAAADAFAALDAPWAGTMSFDSAGRTMMGLGPIEFVELIAALPNSPLAFGANCGVGASDLLRTIDGFQKGLEDKGLDIPIIAKGNAGIPKYVDGHIHYDGTPELMAEYAQLAKDLGARVIGGCCGTKPEHLVKMRAQIDENLSNPAPSLEVIAEKLGGFSSESDGRDGAGGAGRAPRRGGRRRSS